MTKAAQKILNIAIATGNGVMAGLRMLAEFLGKKIEDIAAFVKAFFTELKVFFGLGLKPATEELLKRLGITLKVINVPLTPSVAGGIKATDKIHVLVRNGKEIFRGSLKEVQAIGDDLAKLADDAARQKYLEDLRIDSRIKRYGSNVKRGNSAFKKTFETELQKIAKKVQSPAFLQDAKIRYKKRKRTISFDTYLKKHQIRIQNFEGGAKAEDIFLRLFQGIKPSKAIKTAFTNRFIDNILNGTGKEIKSGLVKNSKAFQKQFTKDVDIIKRKYGGIGNYEWHVLGGIEDEALEWAIRLAKQENVENKILFILY